MKHTFKIALPRDGIDGLVAEPETAPTPSLPLRRRLRIVYFVYSYADALQLLTFNVQMARRLGLVHRQGAPELVARPGFGLQ